MDNALMSLRFIAASRLLRQHYNTDMPYQQVMMLVCMYYNELKDKPALNQTAIAKILGLKIAACSRHCRSLSTFYVKDKDEQPKQMGQGLIIAERNLTNAREVNYRLTAETKANIAEFIERLGEYQ